MSGRWLMEDLISVAGDSPRAWRNAGRLTDRLNERRVLDRIVNAVREGQSRALVLRGEPGVGKTALLDYLSERAAGCQVAHRRRAVGDGARLPGVHQLCAPLLDSLEVLPEPQRDALRTAFGISPWAAADKFLIGLAVLGLLSEAAGQQPLICLVDDHQWPDRASAQTLGFVARRLAANRSRWCSRRGCLARNWPG